jgi:RHS repeat-associated protein
VSKEGAEVATFLYDPLGRRVQKTAGGTTTAYLYDGLDILAEAATGTTPVTQTFVHGPGIDEPLASQNATSSALSFYHADGLGSVVRTTDQTGTVVSSRQYGAFGALETGADQSGYAFTGREWDPEIALYYYRARYYESATGRFLSEDPQGFDGGINFYAYVGNGPTNWTDPLGLRPLTDCEKAILASYIPEVDLDNADVREGLPFWIKKDVDGYTHGNVIKFRPGAYDPSTVEGLALLGHELVHVGQYRTHDLSRWRYIKEARKHGDGPENKYEKPAYDLQDQILSDLTGLAPCGCKK